MADIQKEMQVWLTKRPLWWRLPLKMLLRSEKISQEHVLEFSDYALQEAQGLWDQVIDIDFREITSIQENPAISLESISDMQNVNAISSGRSLDFGIEGVTVVYGDNGSGKSGYVRAIKVAGGIAGAEPVKGNIYLSSGSKYNKPRCCVKLSNSVDPITCDLSHLNPPVLSEITVFDTSIAMDYIGTSRGASYEPRIFGVLSELAKIVDQVNEILIKKNTAIVLKNLIIPKELSQVALLNELNRLDHNSQLKDEDFIWEKKDDNKLNEYQSIINEKNPETRVKRLQGQMRALDSINTYLINLLSYLGAQAKSLPSLHNQWNDKQKQYKLIGEAFANKSDDHDQADLQNDVWRNLWKYANEYVERAKWEAGNPRFCPLCRQSMKEGVLDRFNKINDYVNSRLTLEMEEIERRYKETVKPTFRLLDEQTISSLLSIGDIGAFGLPQHKLINEATQKVQLLQNSIPETINSQDIAFNRMELLVDLKQQVEAAILSYEKSKEAIEQKQDEGEMTKLTVELLNLKARKFCHENRQLYEDLIQQHQRKFILAKAEKTAKTNSITSMANFLAELLLSQEYENNFNAELQALTDGNLKVKLKKARSGKGRVPFKIQIEDAKGQDLPPNAILSEGEQRIVSLAAFIADNSMGNGRGPLIFDDPISSLDFEFEGKTVERLVQLSKVRQVIVFTHRLSLLYAFSEICKKEGVVFEDVALIVSGMEKGIPSQGHLKKKDTKATLNAMLQEDITRLKRMDIASPEYADGIQSLCSRFRIVVEDCIEGILLCNITSRFQREIRSTRVNRLKELTPEDCEMVDRMMTKYSRTEHSHSIETPLRMPALDDIESDITRFRAWAVEAKRRLTN